MKAKIENINGELSHYSVGAIIKNKRGEYLLIDRLNPPFGFAGPAGHVDEGENELSAIKREILEETGLISWDIKKINIDEYSHDTPSEPCKHGIDKHIWSLYHVNTNSAIPFILKSDEVKSTGWYSPEQISRLNLEKIWEYWFLKLNII